MTSGRERWEVEVMYDTRNPFRLLWFSVDRSEIPRVLSSFQVLLQQTPYTMSADKRALDDLDALFRGVPAKAVSVSRPSKKLRPSAAPLDNDTAREANLERGSAIMAASGSQQEGLMYASLPTALLPRGFPRTRSTHFGGGSVNGSSSGSRAATAVGAAAADRLAEFVRGLLKATRGDRAAAAAVESKLERKVMQLENVVPAQTEAQSAGARAGRSAGARAARNGVSGKQCKKMGLNALKARDGGKLSFRDLLGLHGLWKSYAARVVSQCGSNEKQLQQRIVAADLQGCYLTVTRSSSSSLVNVTGIVLRETYNTFQLVTPKGKTKMVPKRSCAVRLAFGGRVVDLCGRALEGRRGGTTREQQPAWGRERDSAAAAGGADRTDVMRLPTAAL